MALGIMSPAHPKWKVFVALLSGPEGCNFQIKGKRRFRFTCDNTISRPKARKILEQMGAFPKEIEQSLDFYLKFGGMCDCEILFNVEHSFHHRFARSTTQEAGK